MLAINRDRIRQRIETLASLVDPDLPPYTRRSFTDTYLRGRTWLAQTFREAGLEVRQDAAANLIGVRDGSDPSAGGLWIGSHIDTVMGGGRFDGVAGVIVAVEVAQILNEAGVALRHPLNVVDFLAEEPSDYGLSCVGSRAVAGRLEAKHLGQRGPGSETLADAMTRMGARVDELDGPLLADDGIAAFLELHIEQGAHLETSGDTLGIVSGVVGIRRYRLTIDGQANHAGTTAMADRKDALVAASRVIADVHDLACEASDSLVATVGAIEVQPNSANVVPGSVVASFEVRARTENEIDAFVVEAFERAERIAVAASCALVTTEISRQIPIRFDETLISLAQQAAHRRNHPSRELFSGAGHDAAHLAARWPAVMLFVPSRGGISHHPDEWTELDHLVAGAETMLDTLLDLDGANR